MEKYLFNDGTNVIREVQSKEELEKCIQSAADPAAARIWVYHSSEWISPAEWRKRYALAIIPASRKKQNLVPDTTVKPDPPERQRLNWLRPVMIAVILSGAAAITYKLTRTKWTTVAPVAIQQVRPANVPVLNIDSLIQTIEGERGKKLDKVTSTNLRIRNSWPDRLLLTLTASKDSSNRTSRFYNMELILDNATGYQIDEAVVEVTSWAAGERSTEQMLSFRKTGYSAPARKKLDLEMKGDSLTVRFISLRAKAFNFCYDASKKSNSGNYNDRWFCRD